MAGKRKQHTAAFKAQVALVHRGVVLGREPASLREWEAGAGFVTLRGL
jgi:hypothetical protein